MPGHSIQHSGKGFVLHSVPSGIFREGTDNLIGNGVVLDPIIFQQECTELEKQGVPVRERIRVSKKAHLITPTHRIIDAASEASKGKSKIGSTLKGIGPTYMDKTGRNGLARRRHTRPRLPRPLRSPQEEARSLSETV